VESGIIPIWDMPVLRLLFDKGMTMPKSIYKKNYNNLKKLLIGARKTSGLTQSALADKLSKPQSFVSKYESGERRLDVIEFIEITDALSIDPAKIIKQIKSQ